MLSEETSCANTVYFSDFTLKSESVTQPVKKAFDAKIVNIIGPKSVQVNKSYNDISFALGICRDIHLFSNKGDQNIIIGDAALIFFHS